MEVGFAELEGACTVCGRQHDRVPLDFGAEFPDPYLELDEDERERLAWLSRPKHPDFCVITYPDQTDRFVRGVIQIPLSDRDDAVNLGVWSSLSGKSYAFARESWHMDEPPVHAPMFGWLCTELKCYPGSRSLKLNVQLVPGRRPAISLHRSDHPMYADQSSGMKLARWVELLHIAVGEF